MENGKTNGRPAEDSLGLRDLWGMYLPEWRWFALSLALSLAAAALYILSSPDV